MPYLWFCCNTTILNKKDEIVKSFFCRHKSSGQSIYINHSITYAFYTFYILLIFLFILYKRLLSMEARLSTHVFASLYIGFRLTIAFCLASNVRPRSSSI